MNAWKFPHFEVTDQWPAAKFEINNSIPGYGTCIRGEDEKQKWLFAQCLGCRTMEAALDELSSPPGKVSSNVLQRV